MSKSHFVLVRLCTNQQSKSHLVQLLLLWLTTEYTAHSTQQICDISHFNNPHRTHALAKDEELCSFIFFLTTCHILTQLKLWSSQNYTVHSRSHLVLTEIFTFLCAPIYTVRTLGEAWRGLFIEKPQKISKIVNLIKIRLSFPAGPCACVPVSVCVCSNTETSYPQDQHTVRGKALGPGLCQ